MKKILVLEPSKKVTGILKVYFTNEPGLKMFFASNSQEAIDIADRNKPDLVVLELAIPKHNGFAFLHEFRSYPDWKNIPVIVHSHLSIDEASSSKSWSNLGAVEYLYKPETSLSRLKQAIKSAL